LGGVVEDDVMSMMTRRFCARLLAVPPTMTGRVPPYPTDVVVMP
jgi:hypothetical protein